VPSGPGRHECLRYTPPTGSVAIVIELILYSNPATTFLEALWREGARQ
jgi:hypothetical protein